MTWEQCLDVLDQFSGLVRLLRARQSGGRFRSHITLTGGEPFVRPDFLSLLETIRARGEFGFSILSNGTLMDLELVGVLQRLAPGYVQVSVEGSKVTHDQIRGAGSFEQAVSGIQKLMKVGIPVMISFTAQRKNFREFPQVAELGRTLGVYRVWADRMVPLGRGGHEDVLSSGETLEFMRLMLHERERLKRWGCKTEIAMHRALQFALPGGKPYRCLAGYSLMTLLPNGDICPCRRMPMVVGNLFSQSLTDLYLGSPLLRELRDWRRVPSGCESCFYAWTCGGGLRCLSSSVTGNPFVADPGCWMAEARKSARSNCEMVEMV